MFQFIILLFIAGGLDLAAAFWIGFIFNVFGFFNSWTSFAISMLVSLILFT